MNAVLLDVGGTLWPEAWPSPQLDDSPRAARLRTVLPDLTDAAARDLLEHLKRSLDSLEGALLQDSDALIREVLQATGLPVHGDVAVRVRKAMYVPARGRIELFPGARGLLQRIRDLGLACVILSNSAVRDNEDYWRDFADFGVAQYVDAIVSSVDAGYRKPHPAIFAAAVAAADCPAAGCIMVGNSERNDIAPAVALGMRAIRVAIEEPPPAATVAGAVAGSLDEVAALLAGWVPAALAFSRSLRAPPRSPRV